MSTLLTDRYVYLCVTLVALMHCSTNPVELERYRTHHATLLTLHPELHVIRDDDPRVEAAITELRAAFEQPERPVEVCYVCGHLASHRRDYGNGRGMLPVCGVHLNGNGKPWKRMRPYTDPGDTQEHHARRDR